MNFIKNAIKSHKKKLIEFDEEKRLIRYGGKTFVAYDIESERGTRFFGYGNQDERWHLTIKATEIDSFLRGIERDIHEDKTSNGDFL